MLGEKETCRKAHYLNDNHSLGCYDTCRRTLIYYYEVPLSTKQQINIEFYCVSNNECHLYLIFKSILN